MKHILCMGRARPDPARARAAGGEALGARGEGFTAGGPPGLGPANAKDMFYKCEYIYIYIYYFISLLCYHILSICGL